MQGTWSAYIDNAHVARTSSRCCVIPRSELIVTPYYADAGNALGSRNDEGRARRCLLAIPKCDELPSLIMIETYRLLTLAHSDRPNVLKFLRGSRKVVRADDKIGRPIVSILDVA